MRIGGKLEEVSWSKALAAVAAKFKEVKARGGKFGVIGSTRTTNEENYYLQKFAREGLGTNNIDHHRTGDVVSLLAALEGRRGRAGDHRGSLPAEGHPGGGERPGAAAPAARFPDPGQLAASRVPRLRGDARPGARGLAGRRAASGPRRARNSPQSSRCATR